MSISLLHLYAGAVAVLAYFLRDVYAPAAEGGEAGGGLGLGGRAGAGNGVTAAAAGGGGHLQTVAAHAQRLLFLRRIRERGVTNVGFFRLFWI